jgi:hypothetical protein
MNYYVVVAFSFSILIAACIGIYRIRTIAAAYYPFILYTWLAAVNEAASYYLSKTMHNNTLNNNIYVLPETLLLLYQFKRWGIFNNSKYFYYALFISVCAFWLWEYHDVNSLMTVRLHYRLYSAFLIVLMSVHLSSKLIIEYRKNLYRHPAFLVCAGLILLNTFLIFVETFWMYGLQVYPAFRSNIFYILAFINLFVNLLFTFAVLCIPLKPRYIMLY